MSGPRRTGRRRPPTGPAAARPPPASRSAAAPRMGREKQLGRLGAGQQGGHPFLHRVGSSGRARYSGHGAVRRPPAGRRPPGAHGEPDLRRPSGGWGRALSLQAVSSTRRAHARASIRLLTALPPFSSPYQRGNATQSSALALPARTVTAPPCWRTVSLTMDRPRPVPPAARERACPPGKSGRTPCQVLLRNAHAGILHRDGHPGPPSRRVTVTLPPGRLYLTAFSIRLKAI